MNTLHQTALEIAHMMPSLLELLSCCSWIRSHTFTTIEYAVNIQKVLYQKIFVLQQTCRLSAVFLKKLLKTWQRLDAPGVNLLASFVIST